MHGQRRFTDAYFVERADAMRIIGLIGIILLFVLSNLDARAEIRSMRCGGKLVQVGDFEDGVVAKCGSPRHVETFEDYPGFWVSKRWEDDQGRLKAPYLLRSPIEKEIWTYQPGTNRLPYYLHFYKGRLTRIETGKRSRTHENGSRY